MSWFALKFWRLQELNPGPISHEPTVPSPKSPQQPCSSIVTYDVISQPFLKWQECSPSREPAECQNKSDLEASKLHVALSLKETLALRAP